MYIRNLFFAVVLEQTPHIARILNSEGCIFEDDEMLMNQNPNQALKTKTGNNQSHKQPKYK